MALPVLSRAGVLAGWLNGGYGRWLAGWLAGWLAARQQQRNTAQQEHQEEDDKEASIHPASRPVRRRMPCDPTVTEPAGSCRQLAVLVPALGADLRCHIFFVSLWLIKCRCGRCREGSAAAAAWAGLISPAERSRSSRTSTTYDVRDVVSPPPGFSLLLDCRHIMARSSSHGVSCPRFSRNQSFHLVLRPPVRMSSCSLAPPRGQCKQGLSAIAGL
jgi:hypothetical protein